MSEVKATTFDRGLLSGQLSAPDGWTATSDSKYRLSDLLAYALWRPSKSDETSVQASWGYAPTAALWISFILVVSAITINAQRSDAEWAKLAFYLTIGAMVMPVAARCAWPDTSRFERGALVIFLTLGLFFIRVLRAPNMFVDHDEFLHWRTAIDILNTERLFTYNPLLPVSPQYPGLEIVTTALVHVTGISIFAAGVTVVLIARIVQMLAMFALFERLFSSSRVGALACIIYMGCPTFVIFNAQFSYESLALALAVSLLLLIVIWDESNSRVTDFVICAVPLAAALAISHHMTAYALVGIALAYVILGSLRDANWKGTSRLCLVAVIVAGFPYAWSTTVGGGSDGYLGRILEITGFGVSEIYQSLGGSRPLFVAADGSVAPKWQRWITIGSVVFVCAGLATGFFRSFRRAGVRFVRSDPFPRLRWNSTGLVVLTLLTLAYPVSVVLRLSGFGWEFGNRLSTFAFLGVGPVVALSIFCLWWRPGWQRASAALTGLLAAVLVTGGIISGSGQFMLPSSRYRVVADIDSIEPMSIGVAQWTREWLGEGNRFMADRVNRLLLSTVGRQDVVDVGDSGPIVAQGFGRAEVQSMQKSQVGFALLDMRLTQDLPVLGFYLDSGSEKALPTYKEPIHPATLLKFYKQPGVSRIYDNGYMTIANVGSVSHAR